MMRKGIRGFKRVDLRSRPLREGDFENKAWQGPSRKFENGLAGYCVVMSRRDGTLRPWAGWSRTNMLYGPWRKQTSGRRFWVRLTSLDGETQRDLRGNHAADRKAGYGTDWWREDKHGTMVSHWFDEYWTHPVYWVEDAVVYRATLRSHERPTSP